jgi:Tfp pilus assembly PilM family ATPase
LSISDRLAQIAITDKGKLRVTGGIAIGGNDFTVAISKHLNITIENAHQLKTLNGLSAGARREKIQEALSPSLSRITAEIRRVMRYYDERISNERKLAQLLIVGSGSNMPGLGDFFTNEIVIAARVASPWQKLDFGKLAEPGKQFRPRYMAVTGLATIIQGDLWK